MWKGFGVANPLPKSSIFIHKKNGHLSLGRNDHSILSTIMRKNLYLLDFQDKSTEDLRSIFQPDRNKIAAGWPCCAIDGGFG